GPLTDDSTVDLAFGAYAGATETQPSASPELGTVLGSRYRLEQIIGRGGTSVVYRARDLRPAATSDTTSQVVAVKLSLVTPGTEQPVTARLYREFHTMRALTHAGIARVFELDRERDLWFMSMELIVGRTLRDWMVTGGAHAQAIEIIRTCCAALQ